MCFAAFVAACAAEPVRDERFAARHALAEAAEGGPVRAVVHGRPFDLAAEERDALTLDALADGVRGLGVSFARDPTDAAAAEPHLVVVLNPTGPASGGLACRAPDQIGTAPSDGRLQVLAAFCDGDEPLGVARTEGRASGPDERDFRRLLWRAAGELFPDDYESTYGFGVLPPGVGVGVGGSIGF